VLEAWDHLGEAQRIVASMVDVPELSAIDTSVTVTSGNDYVEVSGLDYSVYAVFDVFNRTDSIPMYPEPSGMMGRRAYLESDGKPAANTLTHYQRDGSRIYVRGKAASDTTLQVRFQRQMPELSDADVSGTPITPQQYDRAIVHKAAELYYLLHPSENEHREGERVTMMSSKHRQAFEELFSASKSPRVEEDRPRQEQFRLSNFRMAPRSRRWV
jgi:hypothetical protein